MYSILPSTASVSWSSRLLFQTFFFVRVLVSVCLVCYEEERTSSRAFSASIDAKSRKSGKKEEAKGN